MRAFVEKEPRVEIKIMPPEFIGPGRIERAFEIEAELVVKRFPRLGVAGPVKLDFRPCPFAAQ
jgi:hypothetical protein